MALPDVSRELASSDHFLVTIHVNPDGDAIGSLLGMVRLLRKLGKRAVPVSADGVPPRFHFLPGSDEIIGAEAAKEHAPFETAVVMDSGDLDRVGDVADLIGDGVKVINIDHHISNPGFGDAHWVDTGASAVCEMLVDLYGDLGVEIDAEAAEQLYTGIATDTGTFRFSNATPTAFTKAAELVRRGANPARVADEAVMRTDYQMVQVLSRVLSRLELRGDGRVGLTYLAPEEQGTDTEGFVEWISSIDTVEVAVLLRPVGPDQWKLSLRSTGTVNVSELAGHWGGGGHAKAAGGRLEGTLDEVRERVFEACLQVLPKKDEGAAS